MGMGIPGLFEISIFATKFNLLRGQPKAYPFDLYVLIAISRF